MLNSLNLDTLEDRYKVHQLSLFYLAVNNLIAFLIPSHFLPKQYFTRSFHNISFIQPSCNHDYYLYSYLPRTASDWNTLPSNIPTYHLEIIVPHISEIIDCCFIFLLVYIYPIDFLKLLMKYVHYYFKF